MVLAVLEPGGGCVSGTGQLRRTALPWTGSAEPPPAGTPAGFNLIPKQRERRRANIVCPRGSAETPLVLKPDPGGAGSARRRRHRPPLTGRRGGGRAGADVRRAQTINTGAADVVWETEERGEKKRKKNIYLSYLFSSISSSASSWTCISAARSALPTPCCCPGRMSCLHFSETAPRRDVFLPWSFSLSWRRLL